MRDAHLDCLGVAAGLWLSMGTSKDLTQYVVVGNFAFPYEDQQVTPGSILYCDFAQRWGVKHHIDGIAYFDGTRPRAKDGNRKAR